MMRWDALGETRVAVAGGSANTLGDASAFLDACTVPLVVHDYSRAAVLGTATLVTVEGRLLLVTAAHLFDSGVRFGNLLAPLVGSHEFRSLAGARLLRSCAADVALIDLSRVAALGELLKGRCAAPVLRATRRLRPSHRRESRAMLSGYPASLSRFCGGWLAARRLTVVTEPRAGGTASGPGLLFHYARTAPRDDGTWMHTPELEGMSGAGIWASTPHGAGRALVLRLAAVQSTYVHGRYLRGHDIGAALELLRS